MLTLRQLDSIVHNTLLVFKGFEINRREEGTNVFYDVYDNHESGKRFLGTYRVWEWHDGSGRSGWSHLEPTDPEIEKIRNLVWDAIMAIAVPANKESENESTPITIKVGKSIYGSDDYSKKPMYELKRLAEAGDKKAQEIISGITERIIETFVDPILEERSKLLADPYGKIILPWLEKQLDSENPLVRLSVEQHSLSDIWDMVNKYPEEATRDSIDLGLIATGFGTNKLPSEILHIDKVAQNATLQQALILYIYQPEMTLSTIAEKKKYKSQKSLATLISNVRKELIKKYGEEMANQLLPHRKANSSWRKVR